MKTWINFSSYFFAAMTGLASLVIVLMVFVILANIFWLGKDSLTVSFLFTPPSQGMMGGGIYPAIIGTFALVLLMSVAVMPLGIFTAVYLHEYAKPGSFWIRVVRLSLHNLAGVPAIVFGLFGLGFFVHFAGGNIDKLFFGGEVNYGQPAIVWAALTMAILTLPTVVVATEESLRAVPDNLREAAYALGATRWQVVRNIVLPNAVSGILTGGILALSRGAGEVAPIMFTGAAYYLPYLPTRLNDQFMELGYHIYVLTTQSPDVEKTKPILYSTVLVLLLLTFALNFIAVLIRYRIRSRLRKGR